MKQSINNSRLSEIYKKLSIKTFFSPFIFIIIFIPSLIIRIINKIRKKPLWLVCEDGEARDNGYWLYRYIRENRPDINCYYAANKITSQRKDLRRLGHIIQWGGLRHWLIYMSANLNISSQKSGNPDVLFWYFVHVKLKMYNNRIFIQHGITHNNVDWLNYKNARFRKFICGAKEEFEFVRKHFGYDDSDVVLLGFARWDGFSAKKQNDKSILIMPTWRNWLTKFASDDEFLESSYYEHWNGLLNNDNFIKYIESNEYIAYFFPHINMYKYLKYFKSRSKNVKVVNAGDIHEYLTRCSVMITDYSSVAFDFAYMNKPVLYYQFDYDEFRKGQYSEGYFSYKDDGFGPVFEDANIISDELLKIKDPIYKERMDKFFGKVRDTENSRRIVEYLCDRNNFKR